MSRPRVIVKTSLGNFTVKLHPDIAPITVKNFLQYVSKKFYDGTIFHRVIKDFMIQGGGYDKDLEEKSVLYKPIKNESSQNSLKNIKYTISMARTDDPNSATSQFFINVSDNSFLDYSSKNPGYCVFGEVTPNGYNIINEIQNVSTHSIDLFENVPINTVIIKSVRLCCN